MKLSDEQLSRLYRERSRAGSSCPDAELVLRLASGALGGPEKESLIEHVAVCADCADALKLARELEPLEAWSQQAAANLRSAPASSTVPWRGLAAAAALVIAAGLGALVLIPFGPDSPSNAVRGPQVEIPGIQPPQGAKLPRAPARLSWPASAPRKPQSVTLFDAESNVIWTSGPLVDAHVELPAELRQRLVPGRYLWRVITQEAIDDVPSPLYRFEIAAEAGG